MYGLINKGLRSFIVDSYGSSAWESIANTVDPELNDFFAMNIYDDDLTFVAFHAQRRPD